ncbi:MAG: hypothetical protein J2P37_22275, partial [Ktedonobacteraceae bacterium]|nr:hypothetical protein [Ktedonobacteraceae bacterium]
QHAAKRPRKFFSLYTLATAAVLILAVVLLVRNLAPNVFNPLSQQPDLTNTPIQHFVDTFANDDHQWVTQDPGLIARVEKHLLDLQTSDNNQHLPHPAASVTGKLPQNFTYTVTMTAVEADATAFTYGIAFRLHPSGQRLDQGYAFFVSTQGYYALWKYAQAPPSGQLFTGSLTNLKGLGKENTLAVKVQGHTLSFVVNGKAVPLSGGQPTFTDQNALQDGLPGIYIAGTGTHVRVSRVEIVTSNAG